MPEYEISFRRSAEKDLRKLDIKVQKSVLLAIDSLAKHPSSQWLPQAPRLF
jgi:phage-related protein